VPYVDLARDLVIPKGEGKRVRGLWQNVTDPEDPNKTYIGPNINYWNLAKALWGSMGLVGQPDLVQPMQFGSILRNVAKFPTKNIGKSVMENVLSKTGTEVVEDWLGRGVYAKNQLTGFRSPYFNKIDDLYMYLRHHVQEFTPRGD